MAVSNAIGSNVFDILVCLGIPWFLETCVKDPGSEIQVYSEGGYSTEDQMVEWPGLKLHAGCFVHRSCRSIAIKLI